MPDLIHTLFSLLPGAITCVTVQVATNTSQLDWPPLSDCHSPQWKHILFLSGGFCMAVRAHFAKPYARIPLYVLICVLCVSLIYILRCWTYIFLFALSTVLYGTLYVCSPWIHSRQEATQALCGHPSVWFWKPSVERALNTLDESRAWLYPGKKRSSIFSCSGLRALRSSILRSYVATREGQQIYWLLLVLPGLWLLVAVLMILRCCSTTWGFWQSSSIVALSRIL